jgi:hypothetical protein
MRMDTAACEEAGSQHEKPSRKPCSVTEGRFGFWTFHLFDFRWYCF